MILNNLGAEHDLFAFARVNSGVQFMYLENAASGAFGHFVENHAIWRTLLVKYPVLLTEDGGKRV